MDRIFFLNDRKKLSQCGHNVWKGRLANTVVASFNTIMGLMTETAQRKGSGVSQTCTYVRADRLRRSWRRSTALQGKNRLTGRRRKYSDRGKAEKSNRGLFQACFLRSFTWFVLCARALTHTTTAPSQSKSTIATNVSLICTVGIIRFSETVVCLEVSAVCCVAKWLEYVFFNNVLKFEKTLA